MRVVVSGYASIDTILLVGEPPEPGRTTTIRQRFPARRGGAVAHLAEAMAAAGLPAETMSWIGADKPGESYAEGLVQAGVGIAGLVRVPNGRTPISILAYDEQGGCSMLYDPGVGRIPGLNRGQKALIAEAQLVCLTHGPPEATRDILDEMAPKARLAWLVRADAEAFTPALVGRILARADTVAVTQRERPFVAGALAAHPNPTRLVLELRGSRGVMVEVGTRSSLVPSPPIGTLDVTGASETILGATIAAMHQGKAPEAAAHDGLQAAHALLAGRAR